MGAISTSRFHYAMGRDRRLERRRLDVQRRLELVDDESRRQTFDSIAGPGGKRPPDVSVRGASRRARRYY